MLFSFDFIVFDPEKPNVKLEQTFYPLVSTKILKKKKKKERNLKLKEKIYMYGKVVDF